MNFLQLCAEVQRECDIAGTEIAAVTNQVGDLNRVVNWVKQAWNEIQRRSTRWRWMRSTFSVNTVVGDDTYAGTDCTDTRLAAAVTRFKRWWHLDDNGYSNVKIYLQTAGVGTERWLSYMPWAEFRARYKVGTQNNAAPAHYTIDPQNNLVLGPKPDAVYVVSGEFQLSQQELAVETDIPEMPVDFHSAIVFLAMQKYAGFESAPEVMSRGVVEGNRVIRQLEADQLPQWGSAGPLA